MVNECPNVADSNCYTIGKAAELLGVHRDTLRKHAENGFIKYGKNRKNGRKFFRGSEIKRYWKAT